MHIQDMKLSNRLYGVATAMDILLTIYLTAIFVTVRLNADNQ